MIFGSARLDMVRQPIFKARAAVSILSLLLLGSGYQIFAVNSDNKKLSGQLITANNEIGSLSHDIEGLKDTIAKNGVINEQCAADRQADNEKIGAFAKQAALCNTLRETMHIPQ